MPQKEMGMMATSPYSLCLFINVYKENNSIQLRFLMMLSTDFLFSCMGFSLEELEKALWPVVPELKHFSRTRKRNQSLQENFQIRGFPGGSGVKNPLSHEDSIPVSGRSPGERNGNPPQYSCLENPMDRGTQLATVHGITKRIRHNLVTKQQ